MNAGARPARTRYVHSQNAPNDEGAQQNKIKKMSCNNDDHDDDDVRVRPTVIGAGRNGTKRNVK